MENELYQENLVCISEIQILLICLAPCILGMSIIKSFWAQEVPVLHLGLRYTNNTGMFLELTYLPAWMKSSMRQKYL